MICRQCNGVGYLRIAVIAGPGAVIEMQQCFLCDDKAKWEYLIQFLKEYGEAPPDEEMRAVGNPTAKVLVLRRKKPAPVFPFGPNIG